ncbi:MAG: TIGR00341 family protein [Methylophilaceae bacterium]
MKKELKYKLFIRSIRHRFSLTEDKADDEAIDTSIRSGVELRGTNLWVLIFAIFIASIGLNVNSTAVVIGAMLISPLMGPIMGVGYGVGIYDETLIRKSLRNLAIATGIGLFVSTLYFAITPLSDAQSELLARTSPTIWDVLIAIFGGLAGIIGATRSEKTNIIPGVAIATALMPPLCTAGYGLATLNWHFFLGAFYLYSINCVFIAYAAVLIIWILKLKRKKFVDERTETKVRRTLSLVVLVTMLPSVYLAYQLVENEVFASEAKHFVTQEFKFPQTSVTYHKIDPVKKEIAITMVGEIVKQAKLQEIEKKLSNYHLTGAQLLVYQAKEQAIDVTAIKDNVVQDLYQHNLQEQTQMEAQMQAQRSKELSDLKAQLAATNAEKTNWQAISKELSVQYPQIIELYLSNAHQWSKDETSLGQKYLIVNIKTSSKIDEDDVNKITAWLKVRANTEHVKVVME